VAARRSQAYHLTGTEELLSTEPQDGIGTDFVGYRIQALLGRGGMGVVYRAFDLRLKRAVALKLVAPELALDERFRSRFAHETELAMSLEHPNVVPIYDAGDVDGLLYLAMRYVEGTDLSDLVRAEAPLDPARAVAIARQLGNALDAAHARGLVHRDVKPSNVLLDADEHVYLADLGLTRRLDEHGPRLGDARSVGSPAYVAPEIIEGRTADGRADVYSLGCVLYECLTGQPPFTAGSRLAIAWAHLEQEPPRTSARNPTLPEALDAVVRKALAKDPNERYQTCAALVADAEEAIGQHARASRRRVLLLAAVVVIALVAAAVAAAVIARQPGDETSLAAPAVRENTVVRIDPDRNRIEDVIGVESAPTAIAVGGSSVWVYSTSAIVSEIDPNMSAVRQRVRVTAAPPEAGAMAGPILDADASAAWAIGISAESNEGLLTKLLPDGGGKRELPLDIEPVAIAVGEGAVWVLGRDRRRDVVLRIDPRSGREIRRTRFRASVDLEGLAAGLGGVWTVSPSTGMLYRIDPRSSRVAAERYVGARARGPRVVSGNVWVPYENDFMIVDARKLDVVTLAGFANRGPVTAGFGSNWLADIKEGEVIRFNARSRSRSKRIHVVVGSPFWGDPCLSAIDAGAGALWVTAVPSLDPSSFSSNQKEPSDEC
jgi:hypothetical protein